MTVKTLLNAIKAQKKAEGIKAPRYIGPKANEEDMRRQHRALSADRERSGGSRSKASNADDDPDVNMFGESPGSISYPEPKKRGGKVQTKIGGGKSVRRLDKRRR